LNPKKNKEIFIKLTVGKGLLGMTVIFSKIPWIAPGKNSGWLESIRP
jgi:hypothetical protein